MGIKTLQVFLLISVVFHSTYAAKHPVCPLKIDIMSAKNILELENMAHPLCLSEKINSIVNKEYADLESWKQAHQFLKMAKRVPKSWAAFGSTLAFFEGNKYKKSDYDLAWSNLANSQNKQLIRAFFKSQNSIKVQIKEIKLSQAANAYLNKHLPFL